MLAGNGGVESKHYCCWANNLFCKAGCAGVTKEQYCVMYPTKFPRECQALIEELVGNTGMFRTVYKLAIRAL